MTKAPKPDLDEATIQIARRILHGPPKPHSEIKLGKRARKTKPKRKHR